MFFLTNRAFNEGNKSAEMRKVTFDLDNNEAPQSIYFCWRDDAKKAYVELGSENYGVISRLNGHPAAGIAVNLAPGADALQTADLVRNVIAEQAKSFPAGYQYIFPNDATPKRIVAIKN